MDIKAVVLVGSTAVGKTEISLKTAGNCFEIVSADSVQVYRYLNIGSSKPDGNQRCLVEHHLIDIVNPDYRFTAGDFCRRAIDACNEIVKKDKIPLFVGGTGLYIDSFFKGLSEIPVIDISVRKKLLMEIKTRGLRALYQELVSNDADFAENIHSNDKQRILRGLEVYRGSGRPISSFYKAKRGHESDNTLYIGLFRERASLKEVIDNRVDKMIASGVIDEVIALRGMGYGPELNSMKSIGYLQINDFVDGKLKLDEAAEKIKTETRRYAKRQMTWFRRNDKIKWFKSSDVRKIEDYVNKWVDKK